MEHSREVQALQLNELRRDQLSDLAVACRHLRANQNRDAQRVLRKLLNQPLPFLVEVLAGSLDRVAHGCLNFTAAEHEVISLAGLDGQTHESLITVKHAAGAILKYENYLIQSAKAEWQEEQRLAKVRDAKERARKEREKREADLAAEARRQKQEKKIQALLAYTENGIRVHWQKEDSQLAELIEEDTISSDITAAKRKLVVEWLNSHQFRIPTEEQLEFIIDTHHSIRVTARAGSGKTETVATKILFLLHYVGLAPYHILALVFNVEARGDLARRIRDLENNAGFSTKGPYAVMNFDRLARGVVQPQANILKGSELSKKIQELVHSFLSEKNENSELIQQFMLTSFQADWNKWLQNNERYSLDQLDQLRGLLLEEAIDGTPLKSKGEKRIADFFFEHGVEYKYEYPWRTDRGVVIYPDFYLPKLKLFIEYWGMEGDKDYDDSAEFKRRYWDTKPGYTLIEIFPHHLSGLSPDFLDGREDDYRAITELIRQALNENGCVDIELRRLSDEELLDKLKKRIELEFEKLVSTSLTRLGQRCRTNVDVVALVSRYQTQVAAERQFVDLLPVIDQAYRDLLSANHATDFAQLKWDCIDLLDQGINSFTVEKRTVRVYPDRLRYVFIDEFQDFSELYQAIVLSLLRHANDAVVNAVGDDWQMINRFAGSDLSLFHCFSKSFPRPRDLTLTTNFRSSRQVVEFCNAVMEGQGAPSQVAQHLKDVKGRVAQVALSNLQLTDAEEHYFKSDPTISSLLRLIPACINQLQFNELVINAKSSHEGGEALKPFFYVLSRTNCPQGLKVRAEDFRFINKAKGRGLGFLDAFLVSVYEKELLPASIRALTAHRSKGKEVEVVLLLAPEQYPLIHPTSSFLGIFGDDLVTIIDDERRLFYVACSRARQWLFLLTFAPEKLPDYLPKHLLESFDWSEAPYVRKVPAGFYKVEITNQDGERNALYNNMYRLKEELGFSYVNENGIPIRWQQLENSLEEVARYVAELVDEFRESRLQLTLFDAAGGICFQWPGPVDPLDFLAACHASESSSETDQPQRAGGMTSEEKVFVDPLCKSIYEYFLDPHHSLQQFKPEMGYELMQSGLVVAEAELAWPRQKAAIVLTADDYEQFIDNGWRVWITTSESDEQTDHMQLIDFPEVLTHLRGVTQDT
jgi:DNA helicase-4